MAITVAAGSMVAGCTLSAAVGTAVAATKTGSMEGRHSLERSGEGVRMSWQEYVDNNLMCVVDGEGNTLQCAALVGLENSVWAKSPAFPDMTVEEMEKIKGYLAEPSSNQGSFTIGGVKYMSLGSDDPESKLRGKCPDGGCSVSKTLKTLVIGVWTKPLVASQCNKIVETLAEYLISVDY